MSETKSFRKPYNPPIKATWWTKNPFYIRYMVREGTAVCALFVALELILGIFLFLLCDLSAPEATAEIDTSVKNDDIEMFVFHHLEEGVHAIFVALI